MTHSMQVMLYLHSTGSGSVGPTSLFSLTVICWYRHSSLLAVLREIGLGRQMAAPAPPVCLPTRRASCVTQPSGSTTISSTSFSPPETLLSESIRRRVERVGLISSISLSQSDTGVELGVGVVPRGELVSKTLLCSDVSMSLSSSSSVVILSLSLVLVSSPSVTRHKEV